MGSLCVCSNMHSCVCVCSDAAQPGAAPLLGATLPEGFVLQRLQSQLPLQEEHGAVLSAHRCRALTARRVSKLHPPRHKERRASGISDSRKREG